MENKTVNLQEQKEKLINQKKLFLAETNLEVEYWERMTKLQKLKAEYYSYMLTELNALSQMASLKGKKTSNETSSEHQKEGQSRQQAGHDTSTASDS